MIIEVSMRNLPQSEYADVGTIEAIAPLYCGRPITDEDARTRCIAGFLKEAKALCGTRITIDIGRFMCVKGTRTHIAENMLRAVRALAESADTDDIRTGRLELSMDVVLGGRDDIYVVERRDAGVVIKSLKAFFLNIQENTEYYFGAILA